MKEKKKNGAGHVLLTIVGIVLCLVLIPVLVMNCTLLVKSYMDKESVPNVGGVLPLIVLTDSMYPQIESGDIILCETREPEEIEVGDVIAFFDPMGNGTSVVTHRVVEIVEQDGQRYWRTKGDANNVEDQALVPTEDLVGEWLEIRVPNLGNVAMFMQTSTGLVVCVVVPLVLLVGYDILRRKLYERRNRKNNAVLLAELEELRKLKAEQEQK